MHSNKPDQIPLWTKKEQNPSVGNHVLPLCFPPLCTPHLNLALGFRAVVWGWHHCLQVFVVLFLSEGTLLPSVCWPFSFTSFMSLLQCHPATGACLTNLSRAAILVSVPFPASLSCQFSPEIIHLLIDGLCLQNTCFMEERPTFCSFCVRST